MFDFIKFIKIKTVIILIVAVAVSTLAAYFFFRGGEPAPDFVLAKRGDVVQEVSVTGKVKPSQSVDLAFEKGGKVASINIGVGDRVFTGQKLIGLDSSELRAQFAEAEANVRQEEAKLEELRLGTRPEELEIAEAKVREARESLVDKLKDAYTKSDDDIRNKV